MPFHLQRDGAYPFLKEKGLVVERGGPSWGKVFFRLRLLLLLLVLLLFFPLRNGLGALALPPLGGSVVPLSLGKEMKSLWGGVRS